MRRIIGLSLVLVLVSGMAYGTDYTWTGGAVTVQYDCTSVWNGGAGGFPSTSADCLTIPNAVVGRCNFPTGSYTLGGIRLDNGVLATSAAVVTFRMVDTSGTGGPSGDFLILGNGRYNARDGGAAAGTSDLIDADGDVKIVSLAGGSGYEGDSFSVTMRGVGKVFAMRTYDGGVMPTFTVFSGASVSYSTELGGTGTEARMRNLVVNGTITGGTWRIDSSGAVTLGPGGAFTGGTATAGLESATTLRTFKFGGGTYYDLKPEIAAYFNGITGTDQLRAYRAMGNLNVTHDFGILAYSGNSRESQNVFDTDNGTGSYADMTVGRNFQMGAQSTATFTTNYRGFKANSSTIDIRGDAAFDQWAYIDGGTSTWKFGGNVRFRKDSGAILGFRFDCTTMEGATVHLDGAGAQRVGFSSLLSLGNVVIKKTAGGITMLDNALIKGNFVVDPSTSMPSGYDDNGFYLIFKGGIDCETLAQQIDALGTDLQKVHVMAGSSTFVKLLSDLTVSDNLDIDTGCKLFLNGFTLNAEGQTITSTTPWDQGEIVGAGAIPEPATWLLLGTGALGSLGWMRRRRMQ